MVALLSNAMQITVFCYCSGKSWYEIFMLKDIEWMDKTIFVNNARNNSDQCCEGACCDSSNTKAHKVLLYILIVFTYRGFLLSIILNDPSSWTVVRNKTAKKPQLLVQSFKETLQYCDEWRKFQSVSESVSQS